MKQKYLPYLIFVFLLVAVALTFTLTQQRQEIREKAAEPASYAATSLFFSPPDVMTSAGRVFTLNLDINTQSSNQDYNEVAGVEAHISFDPTVVSLSSIALPAAPFLPTLLDQQIDNTLGTATIVLLSDPDHPVQGTGTLALLNFNVKSNIPSNPTSQISIDPDSKVSAVRPALGINVLQYAGLATIHITSPSPSPGSEELACRNSGGTWIVFPDSCADRCESFLTEPPLVCLQVLTPSCDCGPNACWDGTTCNPNPGNVSPRPTPRATPQTTPRATPRVSPLPTPSATPRISPSPTPPIGGGPTPSPTSQPTPLPTATPRPTPVVSPSPRATPPQVTPRPTPFASPIPTPLSSPMPSPTAAAGTSSLILNLRFEGVVTSRPNDAFVNVQFRASNQSPISGYTLRVRPNTQGTWSNNATQPDVINLPSGTYQNVEILVKGPVHLARRFSIPTLTLSPGQNTLNLTTLLLTGDIVNDNRIELSDYNRIVEDFGSKMPASGSPADVDLDGDVDIFDYGFVTGNSWVSGDAY